MPESLREKEISSLIKKNKAPASQTDGSNFDALYHEQAIQNLKQDRDLKELYARRMIHILVGQLGVMNVIIILVGFRFISLDNLVLQIYMGGTLAEVFGVILVITRSLFPQGKS